MRALVLLIACLVPSLALGQDLTNKYQSLYTSRDAGGLAQLWRGNPGAILVTIDADLEGSLSLWEESPEAPDEAAIEALHARALWGARIASDVTGQPIFADYAASFVGWDTAQKTRFRAGQAAFGRSRQALKGGDAEAALAAASECRQLAEPLGDWWGAAMGLSMEGQALAALGRHEEALASLGQARLLYAQLGLYSGEAPVLVQLIESCTALGRHERALAAAVSLAGLAGDAGDEQTGRKALTLQADSLEALGRTEEAQATRSEVQASSRRR